VRGPRRRAAANAGSAFTALVNCFFVSLVALLPQTGLGYVSITLAIISLLATVRLHREVGRQHLQLSMLVFGLLTYVAQLVNGVLAEVYQSNHGYVYFAAFLMIGQVSGALTRAWSLVEGRHLVAAAQQAEPAAPTSESSAP
jgi:hypothetical protein